MNTSFDIDLLAEELEQIDIDMSSFGFDDMDFGIEIDEEFEDIDYNKNGDTVSFEHHLKIDRTEIILTEEEYTGIMEQLEEYIERNGVSFGFIKEKFNLW